MRITVHPYFEEDGKFDLNVRESASDDEIIEHVECFTDDWGKIVFTRKGDDGVSVIKKTR